MLGSVLATATLASPAQGAITSTAVPFQESAPSPLPGAPTPTGRPGPSPIAHQDGHSSFQPQSRLMSSQAGGGSETRLPMTPSKKAKRKSDVLELGASAPPASRARTQTRRPSQDPPPSLVRQVSSERLLVAEESADSDATEALSVPQSSLPEPDTQPDWPGGLEPEELALPTLSARSIVSKTDENRSPAGRSRRPHVRSSQPSSAKSDRTVRRTPLGELDVQTSQVGFSPPASPSPRRPSQGARAPLSSSPPTRASLIPPPSQRHLGTGHADGPDDSDREVEWRGVPFSPPKHHARTQRFMEDAPPTSLLARLAEHDPDPCEPPTSQANEELRYFAAGAGPVRSRWRSQSPPATLRQSPRNKAKSPPSSSSSSRLLSPNNAKWARAAESEEDAEAGVEQDSSDWRRVRSNRRKRRRSDQARVEKDRGEHRVAVKEEDQASSRDEIGPPERGHQILTASAKPSPALGVAGSARKRGKYDRPLKNSAGPALASTKPSTSARPIELNPDRHQGQIAAFKEVVRNKDQRRQMFASACDECEAVRARLGAPGGRGVSGVVRVGLLTGHAFFAAGLQYYARSAEPRGQCGHTVTKRKDNTFLDDRHEKEQARLQQVSRHRDNTRRKSSAWPGLSRLVALVEGRH